jgi:protease I
MARVAFIVDEMFEDSELRIPYDRLREAGHEPVLIGVTAGRTITGKKGKETITTDKGIGDVAAGDFDALVIPGGYSPDHLRMNIKMVGLVREMFLHERPVAAVCHAPWMLIEADVADGRTMTSWPSIKTDLLNAGARWVDREVVEDGNLITSRKPDDLEAFSAALLRQLAEGPAARLDPPGAPEATAQEPAPV